MKALITPLNVNCHAGDGRKVNTGNIFFYGRPKKDKEFSIYLVTLLCLGIRLQESIFANTSQV